MNYAFKMMAVVLFTFGMSGCAEYLVAEAVLATVQALDESRKSYGTRKSYGNSYSKTASYNLTEDSNYMNNLSDFAVCLRSKWETNFEPYKKEAKSRKLVCGVKDKTQNVSNSKSLKPLISGTDDYICKTATYTKGNVKKFMPPHFAVVQEAKRRGLDCGISGSGSTVIASKTQLKSKISTTDNDFISFISTANNASLKIDLKGGLIRFENLPKASKSKYFKYYEQILEKISSGNKQFYYALKITNNKKDNAKDSFNWINASVSADSKVLIINDNKLYENREFLKKGTYMLFAIRYGAWYGSTFYWKNNLNKNKLLVQINLEKNKTVIASKSTISSAELDASKREANELRKKLVALENKQKQEQQRIDTDTRVPLLEIISNKTRGKRGTIRGIARDNVKVAEVTVDGKPVNISSAGNFEYSTYVPAQGVELKVEVTDVAGLTTSNIVSLKGNLELANPSISFDRLNPISKKVKSNPKALALIVGVSNYENTKAKALYADNDAMVFKDYATEKLGISENRIKILLNDGADERDILLTVREWLRRSAKPNKSDIYVFFAGHGLASQDGKNMYLLPHDGSPRLLEKTAILRDELFSDIKQSNPKSVTVFLDTCYSGVTRNEEMLIAGRPIVIKAKEQAIPEGFTLFSAASNEQISRPLEEAKHGMFSYFLMKGMEGDADANNDNKITARELHAYVEQNVVQQSSGSQTPELQGDKDRVLVKFN